MALQRVAFVSPLSMPPQALVRFCQSMNHGSIQGLCVNDANLVPSPPPLVLMDVKLDANEVPRPEVDLPDVELCNEVCRLIGQLQELTKSLIERIEVRTGICQRIVFRGSLTKVRSPLPENRTSRPANERRAQISNQWSVT